MKDKKVLLFSHQTFKALTQLIKDLENMDNIRKETWKDFPGVYRFCTGKDIH